MRNQHSHEVDTPNSGTVFYNGRCKKGAPAFSSGTLEKRAQQRIK